jgi:hypothetical protein
MGWSWDEYEDTPVDVIDVLVTDGEKLLTWM